MRPRQLTTYGAPRCSCKPRVLLEAAGYHDRPCPTCGTPPVVFQARDVHEALERREELRA